MRALLMLLLCASSAGAAETPAAEGGIVVAELADIYPHLPPEGARSWDPKPLIEAIRASSFEFTPKHVYELIDRQVHVEVIKTVAARAALFYDPATMLPLSAQSERARQGAMKQTVTLDERSFVQLFEFFSDVHNDLAEVEKRVGPLQPRQPNETQSMFERRARARDERLVKERGPFEARVANTTFALTLPAQVVERDGCARAVASWDATAVSFDLFRSTMGTTKASAAPVTLTASPTIELARFTVDGTRRFEVLGRCGTTASRVRLNLNRSPEGQWTGNGQL